MPSLSLGAGGARRQERAGHLEVCSERRRVGYGDAVRPASAVLADSARIVCPAVRGAVTELPTRVRSVVEYHFGWDADVAESGYGGKAVRAALALLSCQALGGDASQAIEAAACVELLHNGSLLHDDIIDADQRRRGRPAAWTQFGIPAALLAGDALFFLALRRAAAINAHGGASEVIGSFIEVIEGEYLDTLLEGRTSATVSEVEATAARKTGALIALACTLGGMVAGADRVRQQHLSAFGHHLGIAFQYVDDVLGLWGESIHTGKPCGADLRARKMSLPIAYLLSTDTAAAGAVSAAYTRAEPLSDSECVEVIAAAEAAGARSWAVASAEQHIAAALGYLDGLDAQPGPAAELEVLSRLLLNRNR